MHAIVSLLDDIYSKQVEQLWAELEQRFGLKGVYALPFPRFSYQFAQNYALAQLEPVLRDFARKQIEFKLNTSGLGIFTGTLPTIFLPIIRSPALSQLHAALWPAISKVAEAVDPYYQPESWLPHITLAQSDVSSQHLPEIIGWLNTQMLYWEIKVNNLALLWDNGATVELKLRCDFGS